MKTTHLIFFSTIFIVGGSVLVHSLYNDFLDDAKNNKERLEMNLLFLFTGIFIFGSVLLAADYDINGTAWKLPFVTMGWMFLIGSFGILPVLSVIMVLGSIIDLLIVMPFLKLKD